MDIKAFVKKDIGKLGDLGKKICTPDNLGKAAMLAGVAQFLIGAAKNKADQEAQTNEVVERVLKKMSSNEQ